MCDVNCELAWAQGAIVRGVAVAVDKQMYESNAKTVASTQFRKPRDPKSILPHPSPRSPESRSVAHVATSPPEPEGLASER